MGFLDSFKKSKMGPPPSGKRPALEVAIGVGKPKDPSSPEEPTEAPESDTMPEDGHLSPEEHQAASTVMDAMQSGDTVAFARALKSFVATCSPGEPDADDTAPVAPMMGK